MLKIKFFMLLLFIPYLILGSEIKDVCIYRFYAKGPFNGHIKIKLLEVNKKDYKISLEQDVRGRKLSKQFTIKKDIKPENFIKEMLRITSGYNKNKIEILEQKIDKNHTYKRFDNEYKGVKIEAIVLMNNKKYKLSYILSKKIPILNLVMFTIEQHIKGRKEYDLKNFVILKEYSYKGKLKKL